MFFSFLPACGCAQEDIRSLKGEYREKITELKKRTEEFWNSLSVRHDGRLRKEGGGEARLAQFVRSRDTPLLSTVPVANEIVNLNRCQFPAPQNKIKPEI